MPDDVREELEAAIDAVIDAAVAAETASRRHELNELERWLRAGMENLQKQSEALQAKIALLCEREAMLEVHHIAETRTLN